MLFTAWREVVVVAVAVAHVRARATKDADADSSDASAPEQEVVGKKQINAVMIISRKNILLVDDALIVIAVAIAANFVPVANRRIVLQIQLTPLSPLQRKINRRGGGREAEAGR